MISGPLQLAIVGTRTFYDRDLFARVVDRYVIDDPDLTIVTGDAPGADELARDYANAHGIPLIVFTADWEQYGLAAGPKRNAQIVAAANDMLAFWDGVSKGTRSSVTQAVTKGIPVRVVAPDGNERVT